MIALVKRPLSVIMLPIQLIRVRISCWNSGLDRYTAQATQPAHNRTPAAPLPDGDVQLCTRTGATGSTSTQAAAAHILITITSDERAQ